MPGSADGREIMYMRFRVQFFKDADQKWHNVVKGGDSGWQGGARAVQGAPGRALPTLLAAVGQARRSWSAAR